MYLVDTDVFSMTNPMSGFRGAEVDAWRFWARRNESGLYLSVVTILEINFGIEKCSSAGATRKAEALRKWLIAAETIHRDRIVPVTIEIAHMAGAMLNAAVRRGYAPSSEDAVIAATARLEGFRVLSRNAKDMIALGADWLDPLAAPPPDLPR